MADGDRDRHSRSTWPYAITPSGASGIRRFREGLVTTGPPIGTLAALLALWHGVVIAYEIPTIILPTPVEVSVALVEKYPILLADAAVTAITAAGGLLFGVVVGLALAFVMIHSRSAVQTLLPYIVALRIAPLIAIAPLLFLWFGRGLLARALLAGTLTIFPMTIATLDGLRSTPPTYLALAQSVDASRSTVFLRIRIPAAAPSIFAGTKIAAALSVVGAVVAEFITLDSGIGYRVFYTATYLQTTESFAALVVLSVLGLGFYLVPVFIEQRFRIG